MNNKSCTDSHQYGLWCIDNEKNIAFRVCEKCNFTRTLPVSEEIILEIKKQEEAKKIITAFSLVDDYDENVINYVNLIMEDYVSYLSKEDFKIFSKRIKKLDDLDILDAKTILYLNKLDTYFVLDNINNNMLNIESNNLNIESYEES